MKKYNEMTLSEKSIFEIMLERQINSLTNLYRVMRPINNKIDFRVKKNGEYGYYINYNVLNLIKYLQENDIKSVLDLGSGAGVLLKILKENIFDLKVKGYEIEKSLITIANRMHVETVKKNILTLKKEDIQDFKVIYFWEPFCDPKLAEKFANNLVKIINKDQIIAYSCSGHIGKYLEATNKLVKLEFSKYGVIYYKLK